MDWVERYERKTIYFILSAVLWRVGVFLLAHAGVEISWFVSLAVLGLIACGVACALCPAHYRRASKATAGVLETLICSHDRGTGRRTGNLRASHVPGRRERNLAERSP